MNVKHFTSIIRFLSPHEIWHGPICHVFQNYSDLDFLPFFVKKLFHIDPLYIILNKIVSLQTAKKMPSKKEKKTILSALHCLKHRTKFNRIREIASTELDCLSNFCILQMIKVASKNLKDNSYTLHCIVSTSASHPEKD